MLYFILALVAIVLIGGLVFINQPKFGKLPAGERLARIEQSPNYKKGKFQNLSPTPTFSNPDKSMLASLWDFLFNKPKNLKPSKPIPHIKTDLHALPIDQEIAVWLGHSSYLLQTHGKRFLIDPVLVSGSPVGFSNPMFDGSNPFAPEDLPEVDFLIITHDHWDHLDYDTVKTLKGKVGKIICPLGVGAHFEHWGFPAEIILEMDWNQQADLGSGFAVDCLPARHGSGRGIVQAKSLWASFMLQTPTQHIFIGGDSGYDTHFAQIAQRFPNIDIAFLENGQYDADWAYIHLLPEDLVRVVQTLHPKRIIAVHNSKFVLARHPWNEPMELFYQASQRHHFPLSTPQIGEIIQLNNPDQHFQKWRHIF
uniref:MBL fold metallo-hydrolase n=1 Tax=Ornithobacterium rhinotracheale TaxID=28251 RepID=UPI0039A4C569